MSNPKFEETNDVVSARLRKHTAEIERLQAENQRERDLLFGTIARRAKAHTDECELLQGRILSHEESLKRHRKDIRRWKAIAITNIAACAGMLIITVCVISELRKPWRTDEAPKLERLKVVAEGWVDKKGVWRSFDTGEPITVEAWKQ